MRLPPMLPTYQALLSPASLVKLTGLALMTLASTTVMAAPNDAAEKLKPAAEPTARTAETMTAPESASTYEQLSQQALALNLAEQTTWRRLLYLKDSKPGRTNSPKANTSPVKNTEFFVSPEGRSDPQAELLALLKMMTAKDLSAAEQSKNQAVLCRFPARIHWLQQQLDIPDAELAAIDCSEFDAWMAKLDPQRLSVIFAEEYLDNPLSAFGHTLMLIDSTKSLADPSAIDHAHALNDTVAGNPDDNFALYAVKSMTGLYPNDITIDPYPEKLAYYLQGDERDVWQYPLQLTHAEIQQIMRHVWETKDLGLPYYFTTDNCASEILRYIDIVRPEGSLLSQLPYVVVPSDVVRLLTDEALITEQTYLPADDSLRQAKINALAAQANDDKAIVETGSGTSTNTDTDTDTDTNPDTTTAQSALLNLPESLISKDNKLLTTAVLPVNNNPNDAHLLQRAMVGVGSRDDLGYLTLGFRAGFNDLLDRPDGYPENFALEGAALSFRVYDTDDNDSNRPNQKSVVLQDLTLIRGRSFNPINSAKTGKTWGLNLGATRVNDGSEPAGGDHLVANAAYEQGVSVGFGAAKAGTGQQPPQLCYALGTGMTQVGKGINNGWRVGVGANLGCRYQLSPKLRAQAEVQVPYWYHGDIDTDANTGERGTGHYWQPIATLGVQYDIDRNQALRLQGNYEFQDRVRDKDTVQLAYVKYF